MSNNIEILMLICLLLLSIPTLAFCLFGRYIYRYTEEFIIIKRYIFFFLPFGYKKILFNNIIEVRRYNGTKDFIRGAEIFGRLFFYPSVIIEVKRGLFKRIFLTPENPDEFIKIMKKLGNSDSI